MFQVAFFSPRKSRKISATPIDHSRDSRAFLWWVGPESQLARPPVGYVLMTLQNSTSICSAVKDARRRTVLVQNWKRYFWCLVRGRGAGSCPAGSLDTLPLIALLLPALLSSPKGCALARLLHPICWEVGAAVRYVLFILEKTAMCKRLANKWN